MRSCVVIDKSIAPAVSSAEDCKRPALFLTRNGDYFLYLAELPKYISENQLNVAFETEPKRRTFHWISTTDLIQGTSSLKLFARVSNIVGIKELFELVQQHVLAEHREHHM